MVNMPFCSKTGYIPSIPGDLNGAIVDMAHFILSLDTIWSNVLMSAAGIHISLANSLENGFLVSAGKLPLK